MSPLIKKIILFAGIISLVLFIGLMSAAWYLGAFSSVTITTGDKGPYYFVYLEHQGPYYLVANKITEVEQYLKNKNVEYLHSAGMYFDDPATVPESDLRSFGGFLVKDSVAVDEPYKFQKIDKREVVMATIEAHPMIAPFKVYPAFQEWLGNHEEYEIVGAALEIYKSDGNIEVHFPYQLTGI